MCSNINFVIPCTKNDLLRDNDSQYYVKELIIPRNLTKQLRGEVMLTLYGNVFNPVIFYV